MAFKEWDWTPKDFIESLEFWGNVDSNTSGFRYKDSNGKLYVRFLSEFRTDIFRSN